MTETRPGTDAAAEIAILFEEMPEIPCASPSHDNDPEVHTAGPATHYAQMKHDCVFPDATVFPVCRGLAAHLDSAQELVDEFGMILCQNCGQVFRSVRRWVVVLGPMKGGGGK